MGSGPIPVLTEEMIRAGMSTERLQRIRSEPYPQFGHQGSHRGSGSPECRRERHHHHDDFCKAPTPAEWALAGRTGSVTIRSRA